MNHFHYRDGRLFVEDKALADIAAEVGTPFYCYASATLARHYDVFAAAIADNGLDAAICFAVKANASLAVIRTLAQRGCGADVVSEGELRLALRAGVPAERIVFSGVGKTGRELSFALVSGIRQINVESLPELESLNALAVRMGRRAPVAVRVNPDVDAHTHAKISTGAAEHKFGIAWDSALAVCRHADELPGIDFRGLAVHIGSQLTELAPFAQAFAKVRDLTLALREAGVPVSHLDLGGGLGVPYAPGEEPPSPAAYAAMVRETLGGLGCALMFEPGRMLVGNAGVLVAKVIYVKETGTKTFVIVDAAMNDLIRPSMYSAHHEVIPVAEPAPDAEIAPVDVVGPICETGDTFGRAMLLPPLAAGDLVAFGTAGAYGAVMSSSYNGRPLVPEVLVKGSQSCVTRRRPDYEDMLALETLPNWL
ncbi:diaminopimelate decarboxylase [Oleispirillum naphthae]|uniref:diaminopimelate decarboxylase n=1 Tax=Oleispirillum naphthae TaxID=2838853 RepID=UPI0030823321